MRIVVTGGAGFIASNITDAYIERGHEVHIFDDFSTGQRANLNPKATLHQIDIADSQSAKLIEQIKPDILSHHAAQMDVRHSVADPTFDARVNIFGFINLLEGCKNAGVKKVIFASSGGAVYGEQESFPAPESHATQPASPYGVSKRTGELYLSYYHQTFGLPYIALRYANVYGPRQSTKGEAGVVAIFLSLLLTGKAPVINGDGKQTRDYVYVGDVVAANVAALDSGFRRPGQHRHRHRNRRGDDLQSFARLPWAAGCKPNMARQSRANSGAAASIIGAPVKYWGGGRKWRCRTVCNAPQPIIAKICAQ